MIAILVVYVYPPEGGMGVVLLGPGSHNARTMARGSGGAGACKTPQ